MKRNTLLIVDDSELDLAILNEIFKREFDVAPLSDARAAVAFVNQHKSEIAAVIVDILLSKHSNGIALLQSIHSIEGAESIPVVLITSDANEDLVLEGVECGAIDFLTKPVNPLAIQERIRNLVASAWSEAEEPVEEEPDEELPLISLEDARALSSGWQTKMMRMCQYRHVGFISSIEHVKMLTKILATTYMEKFPESELDTYHCELISLASGFADIGQLGLPDNVIMVGPKQPESGAILYNHHPVIGHHLFDNLPASWEPFVTYCKEITLYHHEEYDGSGTPSHIIGDAIPLSAQFVHVALELNELLKQFILNQDAIECILLKLQNGAGESLSVNMLNTIVAAAPKLEEARKSYMNGLR